MALTAGEKQKAYALRHPDRLRETRKKSRAKRRVTIRREQRAWYAKNREALRMYNSLLRYMDLDARRRKSRAYLATRSPEQRQRDNERKRAWYEKNRERINARNRAYGSTHKEQANARNRKRFATNLDFRFRINLRNRVIKILRGINKSAGTVALLGCSIENFKIYLESKFEPGMTWENYGSVWEIDHIIPCALFDLTKQEHQRSCFHFSNLHPLFWRDNRIKGSRMQAETKG